MRYAIVISVLFLWTTGCSQKPEPAGPAEEKAPEPVKILHFYAASGQVARGESTTVCYGVENAKSVRIEPPVEELKPFLNRCFQVSPTKDTTYRLVAEGIDGKTVSESFTIRVTARTPSTTHKQMIRLFSTSNSELLAGQTTTLCYSLEGAQSVRLEPAVLEPLKPAERFCFLVRPNETTTYTLTATGPEGVTDSAKLTIKVK
jgi:acyl-CoA thioesterase FadM